MKIIYFISDIGIIGIDAEAFISYCRIKWPVCTTAEIKSWILKGLVIEMPVRFLKNSQGYCTATKELFTLDDDWVRDTRFYRIVSPSITGEIVKEREAGVYD